MEQRWLKAVVEEVAAEEEVAAQAEPVRAVRVRAQVAPRVVRLGRTPRAAGAIRAVARAAGAIRGMARGGRAIAAAITPANPRNVCRRMSLRPPCAAKR
jgi:hypothetical protein